MSKRANKQTNKQTEEKLTNKWKDVQPVLVPRIVFIIFGQCSYTSSLNVSHVDVLPTLYGLRWTLLHTSFPSFMHCFVHVLSRSFWVPVTESVLLGVHSKNFLSIILVKE